MKYSIFFSLKKRKKKEVFHLFWKKFISKDRNSMSILKDEKLHNYQGCNFHVCGLEKLKREITFKGKF